MLLLLDLAKFFWYVRIPFDQGTFDGLSWHVRLHNIHSHSAHRVFLLERPAFDAAGVATWMATRTLWWEQSVPFRLSAKCSTASPSLGSTIDLRAVLRGFISGEQICWSRLIYLNDPHHGLGLQIGRFETASQCFEQSGCFLKRGTGFIYISRICFF